MYGDTDDYEIDDFCDCPYCTGEIDEDCEEEEDDITIDISGGLQDSP